jgi:chaperonin GroEL (HSP60 family)
VLAPLLQHPTQKEVKLVACACRDHARSIPGKSQVFVNAYARALEVIPRQLCDNAGFDATDVLSRLRNKHAQSEDRGKHFGIDISTGMQLQQQHAA